MVVLAQLSSVSENGQPVLPGTALKGGEMLELIASEIMNADGSFSNSSSLLCCAIKHTDCGRSMSSAFQETCRNFPSMTPLDKINYSGGGGTPSGSFA